MQKLFSANKKYFFGVFIVFLAFVISRLPLYGKLHIPTFWPDSYEYFYYLHLLKINAEGIRHLALELPIGYPLFCYIIDIFSEKVYTIVVCQHLIDLSASIYFLYIIYKYFPKITIWVSVALAFILIDSQALLYDNMLMPESIFKSALLVFCGVFIAVIKSDNKLPKIGLSVCIMLITLIRPNGIFIFIFFPVVLFYLFMNKVNWKQYAFYIIPFVLLNFGWAIYNLELHGYFGIGNIHRMTHTFSSKNDHPNLGTRQPKEVFLRFNNYVFSSQRNREVLRYDDIAKLAIAYDERQFFTGEKMFSNTISADEELEKFLHREFFGKTFISNIKSNYLITADTIESYRYRIFPKGIMFNYYFLSSNYLSPFYSSFMWILLFFIVVGYSCYQYFKTKKSTYFILVCFGFMHFISLFVITIGNVNLQFRYEYATGFIIYIIAAMSPLVINYRINFKKPSEVTS